MRIYLFIAAIAGGATYLLTPLIRHLAIRIGAVGEVRSRDVHTIPTPRMGGLAMMLGFVIAMLFASRIPFIQGLFHENHQAWVVMIGAVLKPGKKINSCSSVSVSGAAAASSSNPRRMAVRLISSGDSPAPSSFRTNVTPPPS